MDEPGWLWPLLAAPFIGSFLGVLAIRLPAGQPVVGGRSVCDHCGHRLGALELVPIASWLVLRGRCRHCDAAISPLSTFIELGCVAIVLWAATVSDGITLWAGSILGWTLLALAVIDGRDGILPDVLTLPLTALGIVATYFLAPWQLADSVIGAVAGFAVFAGIRWLYRRLRGREGLGMGDAKLMAAAGAWLTWSGLPSVVLIGAGFALAAALVISWRGGARLALDQRLPFGPALCLGVWLVWLYGPVGAF